MSTLCILCVIVQGQNPLEKEHDTLLIIFPIGSCVNRDILLSLRNSPLFVLNVCTPDDYDFFVNVSSEKTMVNMNMFYLLNDNTTINGQISKAVLSKNRKHICSYKKYQPVTQYRETVVTKSSREGPDDRVRADASGEDTEVQYKNSVLNEENDRDVQTKEDNRKKENREEEKRKSVVQSTTARRAAKSRKTIKKSKSSRKILSLDIEYEKPKLRVFVHFGLHKEQQYADFDFVFISPPPDAQCVNEITRRIEQYKGFPIQTGVTQKHVKRWRLYTIGELIKIRANIMEMIADDEGTSVHHALTCVSMAQYMMGKSSYGQAGRGKMNGLSNARRTSVSLARVASYMTKTYSIQSDSLHRKSIVNSLTKYHKSHFEDSKGKNVVEVSDDALKEVYGTELALQKLDVQTGENNVHLLYSMLDGGEIGVSDNMLFIYPCVVVASVISLCIVFRCISLYGITQWCIAIYRKGEHQIMPAQGDPSTDKTE